MFHEFREIMDKKDDISDMYGEGIRLHWFCNGWTRFIYIFNCDKSPEKCDDFSRRRKNGKPMASSRL